MEIVRLAAPLLKVAVPSEVAPSKNSTVPLAGLELIVTLVLRVTAEVEQAGLLLDVTLLTTVCALMFEKKPERRKAEESTRRSLKPGDIFEGWFGIGKRTPPRKLRFARTKSCAQLFKPANILSSG